MSAEEHFVRQLADRRQKSLSIALPTLAQDHPVGRVRADELRAEPDADLMLDEKLVGKIVRRVDDGKMCVEERELLNRPAADFIAVLIHDAPPDAAVFRVRRMRSPAGLVLIIPLPAGKVMKPLV